MFFPTYLVTQFCSLIIPQLTAQFTPFTHPQYKFNHCQFHHLRKPGEQEVGEKRDMKEKGKEKGKAIENREMRKMVCKIEDGPWAV
jgi:hypothetical protein